MTGANAVECGSCNESVPVSEWTVYRTGGGSCPSCGSYGIPEAVRRERGL